MNIWSKIGVMLDAEQEKNPDYRIGTKSRINRESLIGRIVSIFIEEKNGVTATMIAERLGVSKKLVNSIVYKMEEYDICKRDSKYVWTLV